MKISLIVPVFNEEDCIEIFYRQVLELRTQLDFPLKVTFINDGSTDSSQEILNNLAKKDSLVSFLEFSRNFGKEAALMAGIEHDDSDAVILIDVDLQHPVNLLPSMIDKFLNGYDVVLARNSTMESYSKLNKITSKAFYKVYKKISSIHIEPHVSDFRLLSKPVLDTIRTMPERNLFMKGILSWPGFSYTVIDYKPAERSGGKSKFHFTQLWKLALEGLTSFSTFPLKICSYLGFTIAGCSFIWAMIIIFEKIFYGNPVAGYPSLITIMLFLGGIQLIGLGILGEYIGRIYIETKQRPRYVIKHKVDQTITTKIDKKKLSTTKI